MNGTHSKREYDSDLSVRLRVLGTQGSTDVNA
jgi:hypothetical protein